VVMRPTAMWLVARRAALADAAAQRTPPLTARHGQTAGERGKALWTLREKHQDIRGEKRARDSEREREVARWAGAVVAERPTAAARQTVSSVLLQLPPNAARLILLSRQDSGNCFAHRYER